VTYSTESMFAYQAGAFDGSVAYPATSATGRSTVISVDTSTGITFSRPVRAASSCGGGETLADEVRPPFVVIWSV
jgi:hypothetical protein